jgi:translation initiation factor IF-1
MREAQQQGSLNGDWG